MKLKPLHDRILVKRLEEEQVTKGGIIIPDSAKEKPIKGEVVAVGPGKTADDGKLVAMCVKAGDKVIFNKYAGTEVKIDGDDLLIMREDDVLAVIEGC
jgi:chaperonin GroES